MSEVPEGVSPYDEEHERFMEEFVRKHPPGGYLFGEARAEEVVRQYIKMDKAKWQSMLLHDYLIAYVKRDKERREELKKAYGALVSMFDWSGDMLGEVESRPMEVAGRAVETLFGFYRDSLVVSGWRQGAEETIADGLKRRLDVEPSPVGDKFRTEYGRWLRLVNEGNMLEKIMRENRHKDMVATWMAGELETCAYLYVFGRSLRFCYLDYALKELTGEVKLDKWEEEGLWWVYEAMRSYLYHTVNGMDYAESLPLLAAANMAITWERTPSHPRSAYREVLEFVDWMDKVVTRQLQPDMKRGELRKLFYDAFFGPKEETKLFYETILTEHELLTEEQKAYLERKNLRIEGCMHIMLLLTGIEFKNATHARIYWQWLGDWDRMLPSWENLSRRWLPSAATLVG